MRWIGWILLSICFGMAYVLRLSAGVLREALGADFALSASTFGLMSSMAFYSYTLMQIPVGVLADSRGVRFTVVWGMLISGAGALLFAVSSGVWGLYAGRILIGVGVAGAFVCTMRFLANNFSGDIFGTLSGATSFIGNTGAILAQAPLAFAVALLTWRVTFSALGGVCLLLAFLAFFILPPEPYRAGGTSFSLSSLKKGIASVYSRKGMIALTISYLGTSTGFFVISGTWGVSWVSAVTSLDSGPFLAGLNAAGMMVGVAVVGRVSDRLRSRRKPLIFFAALQALAWGLFVFFGASFLAPLLGPFFFSLGFFGGSLVVYWTVAKELNTAGTTGLSIALINTANFLSVAVLTSLIGFVLDWGEALPPAVAYRNAFTLQLAMAVLGFISSFFVPESFGRRVE